MKVIYYSIISITLAVAIWSLPMYGTDTQVQHVGISTLLRMPYRLSKFYLLDDFPERSAIVEITQDQLQVYHPNRNRKDFYENLAEKHEFIKYINDIYHKDKIAPGFYTITLNDNLDKEYTIPFLTFAAHQDLVSSGNAILIPDRRAMTGYEDLFRNIAHGNTKFIWEDKQPVIFWRGNTSDYDFSYSNLKNIARINLVNMSNNLSFIDAYFTHIRPAAFADFPEKFFDRYEIKEFVTPKKSLKYKYLISIDGATCTYSRVAWILYSNSVLMKHDSDHVQWYYNQLVPWKHYIPIDKDFGNIKDAYSWAEENQLYTKEIAFAGHNLAAEIFSDPAIERSFVNALDYYNSLDFHVKTVR